MNLFVYGSLRSDAAVLALTGKKFKSIDTSLQGFGVFRLDDRFSPGMIESPRDTAEGRILVNVDRESFDKISSWEDDDYRLAQVRPDGFDDVEVVTFIKNGEVLDEHWDYEEFLENHLDFYLDKDIPEFLSGYYSL